MVSPGPVPLDWRGAPRFIYLAGCDGTGKTTQASLLVGRLLANGVATRRLWLRFPFFFSLPLLAYARLRGFSHSEEFAAARHGYWDFEPSRLMRAIFPWALLADASLAAARRVCLPLLFGRTLVCERYVLDILVDLDLAFKDSAFHRRLPGRLFLRLLPMEAAVVILDLDAYTARARRPDLLSDRRLEARLEAYRRLADELLIPCISSQPPLDAVHRDILALLLAGPPLPVQPGYARLRSPALRKALRCPLLGPFLALASHWTFQGFFCMGWVERAFKLALDLPLALALGLLLSLVFPWGAALLSGFLAAHTLNFLFNGHLWGALKHYGFVHWAPDEFAAYADALQARVRREPSILGLRLSGGLARGAWTPASDFDARLLPAPGALNTFRACCFLLQERSRALFARFPLDLYLEGGNYRHPF